MVIWDRVVAVLILEIVIVVVAAVAVAVVIAQIAAKEKEIAKKKNARKPKIPAVKVIPSNVAKKSVVAA